MLSYNSLRCVNAGLFEQHKLLFSFSMTVKIQEVEDSLDRDELDFFMKVRYTIHLTCQLTDLWAPEALLCKCSWLYMYMQGYCATSCAHVVSQIPFSSLISFHMAPECHKHCTLMNNT